MNHISLGQLAEHIERRLSQRESKQVQEHLRSGCERCGADAEWVALLKDRTATDTTLDAPDWLLERALVLFQRVPAEVVASDSEIGALVYDSRVSGLPTGVRRAGSELMHSMLFRCEGYDVDLQIRVRGAGVGSLRGQILPLDPSTPPLAGARVELLELGESREATTTDAYGEFGFDAVPTEPFDLCIRPHSGGELFLPGVEARVMGSEDD
jgi:hypothetical protein